jgi:hypothetical protein
MLESTAVGLSWPNLWSSQKSKLKLPSSLLMVAKSQMCYKKETSVTGSLLKSQMGYTNIPLAMVPDSIETSRTLDRRPVRTEVKRPLL